MEKINPSSINTADQILDLFQQFALRRPRLIAPEYFTRLQQHLDHSERGSGDRIINFPLMLRIFTILAHRTSPPTMSELGSELDMPLSTVTRVVDWLVRGNLLERVDDPSDRRIVRVRFTETGLQIFNAGLVEYKQRLSSLLEIYTPEEQNQLVYLVKKLVNALST